MKPEDFLMALNDADDAYVKKAGIKGGYFTLHQETSNSNTEARGIPGNLHQETAKQRNFKRFCIAAAACLAVAALSWGTLALLRQSPMWGKNSPAGTNPTVGSNPTDGIAPSDASHEKMTGEMTEPVDLLAVDRGKVSLIWVGDWQASCIANDAPSKAVHSSLREDPLLHSTSNYTMSTGILDEGEQAQLLEQARTGELSLQNGLGPELAALAASEPERVVVVRTRWSMCSKSTCHTEDTAMVQFFFTVQGEDGFWRIMDATDRQNEELPNLSEEDVAQMLEQYGVFLNGITYTPDADAYKTLNSMMENAHKLHPNTAFSHGSGGEQVSTGALKTLKLQNGKNAELTEMLEAGSKDITIISQKYSYTMDLDTADSIPRSFIIHQTFFLTKNADGLWEILDATYPE